MKTAVFIPKYNHNITQYITNWLIKHTAYGTGSVERIPAIIYVYVALYGNLLLLIAWFVFV